MNAEEDKEPIVLENHIQRTTKRYKMEICPDKKKILKNNLDGFQGETEIKGQRELQISAIFITKTCLYNFDPLKPYFYIVKLGFTGIYINFLISAQKHRLWVLVI